MSTHSNVYASLPAGKLTQELVSELLTTPNLRIERIVSTGQASPPDFWYDVGNSVERRRSIDL